MADLSRPQKLNGAYYYPNAYPVGANRRQTTSNSSIDRPARTRCRLACCCRCLCFTLLAIVLLIGLAMLIIYLMFFPKLPRYTVQDVKIQTLNVSTGSRSVDAAVTVVIRAYNPNKKIGIKYRSINTELFFSGTRLGSSSLPPFYQGKRNVTLVKTEIRGSRVPVSQSTGVSLKSALDRNNVVLNTRTVVKAKVKMGKLTTPAVTVRVNCVLRVSAPSGSGGTRLLGKSCSARVRKIW